MQNPVFLARLRAPFAFISTFSLVVSGFASVPASLAFAADTEQLTTFNPGFETLDGTKNPTGWTKDTFADVGATITAAISTTTDAHSGLVAGKVQVTAVTGGFGKAEARWTLGLPGTQISVTPGKLYDFSDWYKSSTTTSVFIYPNVGGPQWIGDASPQPTTWTQFHGSYFVPAGVTSVVIGHIITDVGTLTTDDYSLGLSDSATAFPQGIVTLTFDDGWQSFWDVATSSLNANNLKATEYIITGPEGSNLGAANPSQDYMSKAEILKLYQSGFDIAAHTRNHLDLAKDNPLTTVPPYANRDAMWAAEITGSLNDLKTLLGGAAPVDSFAYPYGSYCAPALSDCVSTTQQTAGATNVLLPVKNAPFLGARSVDQGYNLIGDLSNDNKFKLKMQHVTDQTTVADLQSWINFARDNKVWLIVMFHHVRAGAETKGSLNAQCVEDLDGNPLTLPTRDADCTTKAVLDGMSSYLAAERTANHVSIKTMHEVLNPDVTPPAIAITSPTNGSTILVGTTTISGTTNDTAAVKIGLNNKFYSATPVAGTWSVVMPDTDALTNGTYVITASSTDTALNVGNAAPISFTVAIPAPLAAPLITGENNINLTTTGVTLTWNTDHAATSRVVWDTVSHSNASTTEASTTPDAVLPMYGYAHSTTEADASPMVLSHSVTLSGLAPGTTYYMRAVSHGSPSSVGSEVAFTTTADSSTGGGSSNTGGGSGGGGCNSCGGGGTVVGLIGGGQVLGASTQALTDEQIAAIINLLKSFNADQSVIDSVNAALHGQATPGTGVPAASDGFVFTKTLQTGSTGNEVTELQKRLTAEGVYSGPISGYFGALTKAGVVAYQKKFNLPQVGIVGPQTRKVLNGN